jgi:hypothetical protein
VVGEVLLVSGRQTEILSVGDCLTKVSLNLRRQKLCSDLVHVFQLLVNIGQNVVLEGAKEFVRSWANGQAIRPKSVPGGYGVS